MSLPAGFVQLELFSALREPAKKMSFENKRLNAGLFSSNTDEWETPQWLFDQLDEEFGFELDVCVLPHNAKCEKFFTPENNGLAQEWKGVCWCNPPYGREISKWVRKAYESAQKKATVVCLIPARTDTSWWYEYCMKAAEIRFIRGRLRFGGVKDNAPFPSAIVIFKGHHKLKISSMRG
jgi:phage N-6-adenine-methyltransferase